MAAPHSPALDGQGLRPHPRGWRDLLRNLWARSRNSQVQQSELDQGESSPLEYSESFPTGSSVTISPFGDFRIEARRMADGWKVTSVEESSGHRHEFYVQGGVIY